MLHELCTDLLRGQVEDRAVLKLDLLAGVVDDVEDRLGIKVGWKDILPVPDLQNLGATGGFHGYLDRGILQGTDHPGYPGSGLKLIGDQVNRVSDFHTF